MKWMLRMGKMKNKLGFVLNGLGRILGKCESTQQLDSDINCV